MNKIFYWCSVFFKTAVEDLLQEMPAVKREEYIGKSLTQESRLNGDPDLSNDFFKLEKHTEETLYNIFICCFKSDPFCFRFPHHRL